MLQFHGNDFAAGRQFALKPVEDIAKRFDVAAVPFSVGTLMVVVIGAGQPGRAEKPEAETGDKHAAAEVWVRFHRKIMTLPTGSARPLGARSGAARRAQSSS